MRLTFRLTIALLTFVVGVTVAVFWYAYRRPSVQTLENPPCVSPPDYETISVPCSGADFSYYSNLPTLSYCELIRNAERYDGKVVRVRGIYVLGTETSMLHDPACQVKDSESEVEMEPYFDRAEFQKKLNEVAGFNKSGFGGRAEVAFLAKFYVSKGEGYGHLKAFRYKLSAMRLERAEAMPPDEH